MHLHPLMRLGAAAAALIAAASLASSARADGAPSAESARADALFQEGKKLLEQGSFGPACERLALSDTLDPTISTLGLLAACHEQQGRTATAWREYRATEKRAEAANDSRAEFARQRAAAIEPLLPRLFIHLLRPSPDVEVLRNLELVPADKLGADVFVDPGAYEILARAPRKEPYRVTITAKEGARTDVAIPELAAAGAVSAVPAPKLVDDPARAISVKAASAPTAPLAPAASNPRLPAALVAGGIGLVGVGIGIAFGVSALDQQLRSTTLHATCQSPGAPPNACATGAELRSGAYTAATLSTVSFGVGAAGLVAGAVLLLLPPAKPPSAAAGSSGVARGGKPSSSALVRAVQVAPTAGGAMVSGQF